MRRSALCRSRRELSNAYFVAKIGFDTAENEPCQVCPMSASTAHPRRRTLFCFTSSFAASPSMRALNGISFCGRCPGAPSLSKPLTKDVVKTEISKMKTTRERERKKDEEIQPRTSLPELCSYMLTFPIFQHQNNA